MKTAFVPLGASSDPMRKILCMDAASQNSYFVTAMLNASYQPLVRLCYDGRSSERFVCKSFGLSTGL